MLAILFLILSFIFGLIAIEKIKITLFLSEKIAWAIILGWTIATFSVFLLSFLLGIKTAATLVMGIIFLIICHFFYSKQKFNPTLTFEKKNKPFLILFSLAFLFFLFLYRTLWTVKDGAIYLTSIGVWADWAMHLSLSSFFSSQPSFSLNNNPLFDGLPLTYTFFADFFSAILISLGATTYFSFILPGFVFSVAIVVLIFFLTFQLTKNSLAAATAPFLFFANGGLAINYFLQDLKKFNWDVLYLIGNLPREYAHLYEQGYQWGNVLAFFFMSQRAFLIGLPLGLIVLTLILNKKFLWGGIFLGLLSIIHIHTFVSLVIVAPFLIFYLEKRWQAAVKFFLPAIVLGAPFLIWVFLNTAAIKENSFSALHMGWLANQENWVWFWFKNVGFLLPLVPVAMLSRKIDAELKFFYAPFIILFILPNIFSFQPNTADNNKIFVWWFLLSLILVADFLFKWAKQNFLNYFIAVLIFISLTFTGVLNIIWFFEPQSHFQFLSREEIQLANFIKENMPANSLILTSDRHNHPVPTLSGRRILMGYRGWLWTWGIDYRQREKEIGLMFLGDKNLLNRFNVNFAVIGPSEREKFSVNEDFFRKNYQLIYKSENYEVFAISRI